MGTFNIYSNIKGKCTIAFIVDLIGFVENVSSPTHSNLYVFDLVLTYGINCKEIILYPHNPILLDHFLVTFKLN